MNIRRLYPLVLCFLLGCAPQLVHSAETPKPGYRVVVKIAFDEKGEGQQATVTQSDDPTSDTILNRLAMTLAGEIKQPPRLKDGKAVPFNALVPFDFPVDGDEGAAANNAPKPTPKDPGQRPVYPEKLAAAGEIGGAILELTIGVDGKVSQVTVLNSSHPEFAESAVASAKTWTFSPAQKDGQPVESRWRTAIAYSTGGKDVDWKWRVAPRPSIGGSVVFPHNMGMTTPATTPEAPVTPAK